MWGHTPDSSQAGARRHPRSSAGNLRKHKQPESAQRSSTFEAPSLICRRDVICPRRPSIKSTIRHPICSRRPDHLPGCDALPAQGVQGVLGTVPSLPAKSSGSSPGRASPSASASGAPEMETRAGVLMGSGASGATETDSRGPALPGIGNSGAKDTERRGAALPAVAMRTRADIKEAVPLAPGAAAAPSCSAGGGAAASACKAVLSLLAAAAAATEECHCLETLAAWRSRQKWVGRGGMW